ncbi:MAG: hypothetical protein ACLUUO_05720 [Sellimonas intestinalis]
MAIITFMRVKIGFLLLIPDNALVNSAIAIFMGTVLSICIALIVSRKWFSNVMVYWFHKTTNDDIWREVINWKDGSNLKIYLKDQEYYLIGHQKNMEEKGEESWIAISAFGKFDKKTNENYREEPSYLDDENVIYTVRLFRYRTYEIFNNVEIMAHDTILVWCFFGGKFVDWMSGTKNP